MDAYYASPTTSFYDDRIMRQFYEQKLRHIGYKPYPNDGLVTFGASGTAMCPRQLVFKNAKDVKAEKSDDIPFRGRQRRIGNATVDYVQMDLVHMAKRLGKDAKFTVPTNKAGDFTFEDAVQQRKVFSYDGVSFAITAKPDGILRYDDGTFVILEFKTKASGLRAMNGKLDYKGAQDDHVRQVIAESLIFNIREVLIVYESTHKPSWFSDETSTSVTKGQKTWKDGGPLADVRAFYVHVTDEMQAALIADLARQAALVYENRETGAVPDVTTETVYKCGFCQFGGHCRKTLTDDNLARLQRQESVMAASEQFAGKEAHRKLADYLAEVRDCGE